MTDVHRLELELDFVPSNEDDLTQIQWIIADCINAIAKNYGRVIRIGRGWIKLE